MAIPLNSGMVGIAQTTAPWNGNSVISVTVTNVVFFFNFWREKILVLQNVFGKQLLLSKIGIPTYLIRLHYTLALWIYYSAFHISCECL